MIKQKCSFGDRQVADNLQIVAIGYRKAIKMIIKELKEIIINLPDEMEVILQKDTEYNKKYL